MSTAHVSNFKNRYSAAAIQAAAGSAIFPETILAAAGLESSYGRSVLSAQYNNFFGIKKQPGDGWTGNTVTMPTKEQDASGNVYTVNAKFRHYDTAADSFRGYVKFVSGPRYVKAGVTTAANPEEQFAALRKAGYATDVNYPVKLAAVLKMFGGYFSDIAKAATSPGGAAGLGILLLFFF
jgi:flagellum-specific peptidoglycan hydrolase FlgJ